MARYAKTAPHPAGVLGALGWHGSKHPQRTDGLGQWIAGILPVRGRYIEPFAGMLGVLLQRQRSKLELVNDLDGRVVNWWKQVRDHPDELAEKVALTPVAERELAACEADQWNLELSDLERARCFTVACWQSSRPGYWSGPKSTVGSSARIPGHRTPDQIAAQITTLASRMQRVFIKEGNALEVIDKWAPHDDLVMYCDPPYRQAETGADAGRWWNADTYPAAVADGNFWDALEDRLLDIDSGCAVAISGNVGDYPRLTAAGWTELRQQRVVKQPNVETKWVEREALWINFAPPRDHTLFDG